MIFLEINASEPLAGILANEPIYYGLLSSAVVYVVVSLMTRPTDPQVMRNWQRRVAGEAVPEEPAERVPAN
jgi:SSS family solute:Na+ symporter